MKKNIIFTGGGSGGHVVPALTLINELKKNDEYSIYYIGGRNGIERSLISEKYYPIFTGKLRRYLSLENVTDVFRLSLGIIQSLFILIRFRRRNTLVFSTGGFVSVPVVFAAWLTRKKIFIHEQTSRVGLANKICSKFATHVFVSFDESLKFFPKTKSEYAGYPVRDECLTDQIGELAFNGIDLNQEEPPLLFITGGGNGARIINELIRDNLEALKERFVIVHQVGKTFFQEYKELQDQRYIPLDFVGLEMIDLYKKARVIISRAGAGTVCELMALEKKTIFIPLKIAQKNEQYHNAMEAHKKFGSIVIEEDDLDKIKFFDLVDQFENQTLRNKNLSENPTHKLIAKINEAF